MLSLSLRDLHSGDGAAPIPIAGRVSAIVLLVVTLTACLSGSHCCLPYFLIL